MAKKRTYYENRLYLVKSFKIYYLMMLLSFFIITWMCVSKLWHVSYQIWLIIRGFTYFILSISMYHTVLSPDENRISQVHKIFHHLLFQYHSIFCIFLILIECFVSILTSDKFQANSLSSFYSIFLMFMQIFNFGLFTFNLEVIIPLTRYIKSRSDPSIKDLICAICQENAGFYIDEIIKLPCDPKKYFYYES